MPMQNLLPNSIQHRLKADIKFCALILVLVAFSMMFSAPVHAQADRAHITVRVFDSSGAAVPRSKIILVNLDTAVQSETVTNDAGLYTIPNVPAGLYKALFSRNGFKTAELPGITVSVAQTVQLDVKLETGSIHETIVVTADSTLLKSGHALLATLIQSSDIRDLPLSFSDGRQIESFAYALTPAVEGDSWTSHIAGNPAFIKEVLIDGLSATSQIQGNVRDCSAHIPRCKDDGQS